MENVYFLWDFFETWQPYARISVSYFVVWRIEPIFEKGHLPKFYSEGDFILERRKTGIEINTELIENI